MKTKKNPWKITFIVLSIVAVFLLVFNFAIQPYRNIHTLTGITKPQTLYSVNKAINDNPIHKVVLCDQFNNCVVTGRLT